MDISEKKTILVTGGSGYIAGELIGQLLDEGHVVATTVRNATKSEAVLRKKLPNAGSQLTVHEADLMSDMGWPAAMSNCDSIAHVASPFPLLMPKNRDDLIGPAVEGTLRVLRAARDCGIDRFVHTSSAAAIVYGNKDKQNFDQTDWTDLSTGVSAYYESKTLAERAARDWVAKNAVGMTYCSINPFAVLGPVTGSETSTSIQIVKRMIDGSVPLIPRMGLGIADVRDVALAHRHALEAPAARIKNERFPVSSKFMWFEEMARAIRNLVPQYAHKVPHRRMPDWLVHLSAVFMPEMKQVRDELNQVRHLSGRHTEESLGFNFIDAEQTIADTVLSLVEQKIVQF